MKQETQTFPSGDAQFMLERDGDIRGPYPFKMLVMMWNRKELRLTDRIAVQGRDTWKEVSQMVDSLEKADKATHSQDNWDSTIRLFQGIFFLLAGIGIYVWIDIEHKRHTSSRVSGELSSNDTVFIVMSVFCGLLALIGIVKVIRGLQTRKSQNQP